MASYTLSVNVYGRGDANKGDGPSHVGFVLHADGSDTCEMHHVRCPDDEHYIYDPRIQPLNDPVLWGRCELLTLSAAGKLHAVEVLTAFGRDPDNIPVMSIGNCQDWLAGTALALEQAGVFNPGEGTFWLSQINCSADAMAQNCRDSGRRWIDGNKQAVDPSKIDARFADKETRTVGKLQQINGFKSAMGDLSDVFAKRADSQAHTERPIYVSSPCFSQTKPNN